MNQENTNTKQRLIRYVNREQMSWRAVDIERLIEQDHQARAIWEMVGRLDVSRFYEAIASSAEEGGRPAIDPQLLISLWVYAYSRGIGAAREVARRCEYDPAFQWLTGMEAVNDHPLADFRVEKAEELDELFTNLLGVLSAKGLITLEEVMQDGTKIKAGASSGSFHREKTLPEAGRWRFCAELQRADLDRRAARIYRGRGNHPSRQRLSAVAAGGGADRAALGTKAGTNGGRRRLHERRKHSGHGGKRD